MVQERGALDSCFGLVSQPPCREFFYTVSGTGLIACRYNIAAFPCGQPSEKKPLPKFKGHYLLKSVGPTLVHEMTCRLHFGVIHNTGVNIE